MEDDKFVLGAIDFLTEKCVKFFKWIGKTSTGKNTKDTVFIVTKVSITIILLALLEIPFAVLNSMGVALIYLVGSTFRSILSTSLDLVLKISYIIICLMVLLKVFKSILSNKELNIFEENRRKDTRVKNKLFLPIISFLRTCLIILKIPVIICMGCIFVLIGMNLSLFVNGYVLFSPFIIFIGLQVILYAVVQSINDIIEECDK